MDQPPGTPALSDFPPSIASAFETAFGRPTRDTRPSAQQWIDILTVLEKSLTQCTYEKLHWYSEEASECPWCAMERELGATLFAPSVPIAERLAAPFDPGAGGFNLSAVWPQIAGFNMQRLSPVLPLTPTEPSSGARFGKWRGRAYIDKVRRQYFEVEQHWLSAMSEWRTRTGVAAIEELLQELRAAKTTYENLAAEEKAQREAYERDRRARQLHAYLDNFEIRRARIREIGAAEEAALASFGIETAADVESGKILRVPGFSSGNSAGLLDWRKRLEAQFVYDAKENDIDRRELARIRAALEYKAAYLRRALTGGRAHLDSAASRVAAMLVVRDEDLTRLYQQRAQLRTDLQHMGIELSTLSALAANSTQLAMAAARAPQAAATAASSSAVNGRAAARAQSSVTCPRCGSAMVRRIAKHRGAAGQQFWGCTRYPLCKGMRT
jgi:predicted RNA-binding Zn-ribbon protein involved in translation (DUF1610 family)